MALLATAATVPAVAQAPTAAAASAASADRPAEGAVPSGGAYGERFGSLCAACHGASGRSDMPVFWPTSSASRKPAWTLA